MNAHTIIGKFCTISFLISTVVFNINCGQSNSTKSTSDDTAKVEVNDGPKVGANDTSKTEVTDAPTTGENSEPGKQSNDTLRTRGCQSRINVKVGSIVELRLEAVPGTGYQWLLKESSQLLNLLDADNLKFSKPGSEDPAVGQSGYQTLHFKAVKKGDETIHLIYKRVHETESAKTCDIKIEVN